MDGLFEILANADRTAAIARDLQGRAMAIAFGTVTDDGPDEMGLRRVKVTLDSKGGKTNTDRLLRLVSNPWHDPPIIPKGASVVVGFLDGNPHDGVCLGVVTNAAHRPYAKADPNADDWRVVPGNKTTEIGGNEDRRVGGNSDLNITGRYDIASEETWHHSQWCFETYFRPGLVAALPAPSADYRGKTIILQGDGRNPDRLHICLQGPAPGTYEWVEMAKGPEGKPGGGLLNTALTTAIAASTGGVGGLAAQELAGAVGGGGLAALGELAGGAGGLGAIAEAATGLTNLESVSGLAAGLSNLGGLGELASTLTGGALPDLGAIEVPGLGNLGDLAAVGQQIASGDLGALQSLLPDVDLGPIGQAFGVSDLGGLIEAVQNFDIAQLPQLAESLGLPIGEAIAKLQEFAAVGQQLGGGDLAAAIALLPPAPSPLPPPEDDHEPTPET